jgi:uracil phosphoribosyltransferase
VTRDIELETVAIETPMGPMDAPIIKGKKLVFASILRAGNGLLDGMLDLVPAARVAHIGIYRDHETLSRSSIISRRRGNSTTAWSSSSTRCWRPAIPRSPPSTS